MKPGFALSLSFEGISLLQRAAGGWRLVGEVAVDSPDLVGDLKALRDKSGVQKPDELRCKVIIPNDQIRYVSVETGSFDGAAHDAMVRSALQGATPYAVDDLVFDTSVDGTTTYVAAVVRDTLVEAESFAVTHGFNPLCFVAAPGDNWFLGEPYFGASAHAATLSESDKVEPDGIAVVVIGPVALPDADPEPDPEPESQADPAPIGFSSRRTKATSAPHTQPVEAEPDPVVFRSTKAKADDAARISALEQDAEAAEQVSVVAPTLDIPELAEPETEVAEERRSGFGAFLSRRKTTARIDPAPLAPRDTIAAMSPMASIPAAPPLVGPIPGPTTGPELTPISRPDESILASTTQFARPDDEASRMTVFGARGQASVGGKPRHLGLILSVALLVLLSAIAAWATIYLEDGVAGLFRSTPVKIELASVPKTPKIEVKTENQPGELASVSNTPEVEAKAENQPGGQDSARTGTPATPTVGKAPATPFAALDPATENPVSPPLAPLAKIDLPSLPAPRRLVQPSQPAPLDLSDTDSAVLEALRQPDPDETPAEQLTQVPAASEPVPTINDAVGAAGKVLVSAPQVPRTPSIIGLDDLYVASIDRTDLSQDAVALPTVAMLDTDLPLGAVSSPVAAGTAFDLGTKGLVAASVEGTLNPDGVMVFLGRPAIVPPATPARPGTQAKVDTDNARLGKRRPQARPSDLEERFQRHNLGGLTREELGGLRPKARPDSLQQDAKPDQTPTEQAVVASTAPRSRPGNMAAIVSAAIRPSVTDDATGSTAPVASATISPRIPSSASVARQATLRNEINLRRVNLIGVYGSPSNRRALVRLPSGRYKKVKVGDSVDGGRVVAIGDSELRYQKSGRSLTLKIPSS